MTKIRQIEMDDGDTFVEAVSNVILSHEYRFGLVRGDRITVTIEVEGKSECGFTLAVVERKHFALVDPIDERRG